VDVSKPNKTLAGFDSKDFARSRPVYLPEKGKGLQKRFEVRFYSPLGVGVTITKPAEFEKAWLEESKRLASEFGIRDRRPLYSSNELKVQLQLRQAIPFCDQLVQGVRGLIESIFVTYVVLPPNDVSTIRVGGYMCPNEEIPTADFLRNLGPMFSYITAWSYAGKARELTDYRVDAFSSKSTPAWDDLTKVESLKVYPHGDECSPVINAADIIAFLTDAKLYNVRGKLFPDDIKSIWKDYGFETEVHFLDNKIISKYTWKSQASVDLKDYLARPMIFLLVDQLEKLALAPLGEQSVEDQPKFRDMIRKMEPYKAAVRYALQKGGALQAYGGTIDAPKVKDGDTLVYVGLDSKKTAEGLAHAYEVEVLSAKELRNKVSV